MSLRLLAEMSPACWTKSDHDHSNIRPSVIKPEMAGRLLPRCHAIKAWRQSFEDGSEPGLLDGPVPSCLSRGLKPLTAGALTPASQQVQLQGMHALPLTCDCKLLHLTGPLAIPFSD